MLYFLYTSEHGDHDNNERGLLLQINHFYSHLHILPAERAVATLNNVDKRVNLAVVMKLMEGKTFSLRGRMNIIKQVLQSGIFLELRKALNN